MTRLRASGRFRSLTAVEEAELRLGLPPDQPSAFVSGADRTEGRRALRDLDDERTPLDQLLAARAVVDELARRHRLHWRPGTDDRAMPAVFDPVACTGCNPDAWSPFDRDSVRRPEAPIA
jgi:hypothetical protein